LILNYYQAAHGQSLSAASLSDLETNSAFLFIKPSAVNPEVIKFVKAELKSAGIKVKKQGTISAEEMTKLETIDHHYHEIAMRAIRMFPAELSVTEDGKAKFKEAFGEEWEVAIRSGRVLNVKGALEKMDAATLTNRCYQ
jgi:nucleoside diphosphate kinase